MRQLDVCDHIQRGALDVAALAIVVRDEADEMLDLGFREDLEFMLKAMPAEKRSLLFSATVPMGIAMLARSYQRDAIGKRVTSILNIAPFASTRRRARRR